MKLAALLNWFVFVIVIPSVRSILFIPIVLLLSACGSFGQSLPAETTSQGTVTTPASTFTLAATATTAPAPIQASPTNQATATPVPVQPSASPTVDIRPAQDFSDAQAYSWGPVVFGLQKPLGLAHAGDGSGRLFILEQAGLIRILKDGLLLPTPFLDITDRVGSTGFEQGLLGLAFHPGYAVNGAFYINYTDQQGDTVIARFQVSPDDPNRADPSSETRLLQIPQPYANHNGGEVAFGPDGSLYLGLGDGGSAGDPLGNGQSLDTLLGKILRLDVDSGTPYAIPPGNPFAMGGGRPEIWAFGLRNPWRFSFDRLTGDLYIGDVGQSALEEINFLPNAELSKSQGSPQAAFNFGWNYYEGSASFSGTPPSGLNAIAPVAEYSHQEGCSVTGGVVYRGSKLPEWQGIYFFGDYCSGRIWGLLPDGQGDWILKVLFEDQGRIASFGEDEAGEIYLVDHAGSVSQLIAK